MPYSQVVPAESEGQEDNTESINLFEVLEGRYAYEGFNKFAFYCFWLIVIYQWALSVTRYPHTAAVDKHKLRKGLLPSKDQFERKEFNDWGIKTMENIVNDPMFFGDEYKLMRATLELRPTLCNHSSRRPHDIKYLDQSVVKSYQRKFECPTYSSMETETGLQEIIPLLNKVYGVYSDFNERYTSVSVPIYSAELHTQNRTNVVMNQLVALRKALASEKRSLRLYEVWIEVLNPYTGLLNLVDIWIEDLPIKTVQFTGFVFDTVNNNRHFTYIVWQGLFGLCTFWHLWITIKTVTNFDMQAFVTNFWQLLFGFCGLLGLIYTIYADQVTKLTSFYMKEPIGTVRTLEETTTFASFASSNSGPPLNLVYFHSHYPTQGTLSIGMLPCLFLVIKHLSWHPGASILRNTLMNAFGDLMDTLIVVLILLVGFGAIGELMFGLCGGSYDFVNLGSSFNTITRLSFGLYGYDMYISDGLGHGYEGIGLGPAAGGKYVVLWINFIVLSTIIVNIIIAVISDGYEIHKDQQRLRTQSGETFIVYALRRLVYHLLFQFFPCCKKYETRWVTKMRFASSKHAKTLLKYTDALPGGMVFNKELQIEVFQTLSKRKPETELLEDMARGFFSNIKSEESLKCIIDAIFAAKKSKAMESFRKHDVYKQIWDMHKHADSVRAKKEVEGNHVRKVVKPMEARINAKMGKMEAKMGKMEAKMGKMEAKMDRILALLEKR